LIAAQACRFIDSPRIDALKKSVTFWTDDEERSRLRQTIQPRKIEEPTIHDGEASGLPKDQDATVRPRSSGWSRCDDLAEGEWHPTKLSEDQLATLTAAIIVPAERHCIVGYDTLLRFLPKR
jgi:hypothetical protein